MSRITISVTWSKMALIMAFTIAVNCVGAQITSRPVPPPMHPPADVLLIPYNDHRVWGYCDTLGEIVIEPKYRQAEFFTRDTIGDVLVPFAEVTTKRGANLVLENGELLLPEKLNYQRPVRGKKRPYHTFLVQKKGKYGVYDLNEGMVLPAKYDSLCNLCLYSSWTLLKRKGDKAYRRYNQETQQLDTERYVDLGRYYHYLQRREVDIATTEDGAHYELQNGELQEISEKDFQAYRFLTNTYNGPPIEDMMIDYDRPIDNWRGEKPTASDLGVDRILALEYFGFRRSTRRLAKRYGFQGIIIAEKNGQVGMMNELGELMLPFQYDKLTLNDRLTQVMLEKKGKVGLKLLFSHHPAIEPRYDKLTESMRLRVRPRWVFAVYEVVLNGQKGYVGENAVEYFRWE